MTGPAEIDVFTRELQTSSSLADIGNALRGVSRRLGARYFALTQHLDPEEPCLRVHNYPDAWAEWFDAQRLGRTDPVHRASQRSLIGFRWTQVAALVPLSARDELILQSARQYGLGGGYTVPANVPGEALGSCSFVAAAGSDLDTAVLSHAQLIGLLAFEASRRLDARPNDAVALTERQIECVLWVGRGKTDWEIGQILGVRTSTVIEHLRHVRDRYAAPSRAMLPVRALYDGALSFADLLRR